MELFGRKKKEKKNNKKNKKNIGKNTRRKCDNLEVVQVVLFQCNLVDNQYDQMSEVLYTFTINKSYAYLLNGEPSSFVFLKVAIISSMNLS